MASLARTLPDTASTVWRVLVTLLLIDPVR